ncbi:hypothetical protein H0H81_011843 [Sphagnurus paluster]|uniref:Autophagy protein 5 n=1 Tax=Sphagnurus paluster TaxID=117069 RepID=A0A9P7GV33_9AGAR|nr:hypothetical protein H0H81_011843 [Sphagnurus paluster]
MSTYGSTRHVPGPTSAASTKERVTDYHTTLFRRLTWEGSVPLEIRVDPKELPANSDRGLECYYVQAPRVSYLPLLMPEIRRFLMDVVFDEAAAKVLKEEDWWFESAEGTLLKWRALHQRLTCITLMSPSIRPSSHPHSTPSPMRLVLHLASPPTEKLLQSPSAEACKLAFMGQLKEADFIRWGNTKRMTGLRKADQDGIWEGIRDRAYNSLASLRTILSLDSQIILTIIGASHPRSHLRRDPLARSHPLHLLVFRCIIDPLLQTQPGPLNGTGHTASGVSQ